MKVDVTVTNKHGLLITPTPKAPGRDSKFDKKPVSKAVSTNDEKQLKEHQKVKLEKVQEDQEALLVNKSSLASSLEKLQEEVEQAA